MPTKLTTRGTPIVKRAEDGYAIYGMEPPDITPDSRKLFWSWVVDFGLKEKDRDLAKGLGADGKALAPISPETRKHRVSAMTPSGKGDPNAPPLTPGWQKSRTRSLLKGRAYLDHADFFWAYDAYTGDSWAAILEYQVAAGRDVFGLGPAALKRVQMAALKRWEAYKAGRFVPKPEATELAPLRQERIDTPLLTEHAIGLTGPIKDRTGFMTQEQFRDYLRATAPATLPGRPRTPKAMSDISGPGYNRLLSYVHQKRIVPGPPKAAKPPKPEPPKPPNMGELFASARPTKSEIADWFKAEAKQEPKSADALRKDIQKATASLRDVIEGTRSVGVEGRGGKDAEAARKAGLYVATVNGITIYARNEAAAQPLIEYLRKGGRYGTTTFSRLLGYSESDIKKYKQFLRATGKPHLITD